VEFRYAKVATDDKLKNSKYGKNPSAKPSPSSQNIFITDLQHRPDIA